MDIQNTPVEPGAPEPSLSPLLVCFAAASLKAAQAHRSAAGALDAAAKGFEGKMAEIKATLVDLATAKAAAEAESKSLRAQAQALSLAGLGEISAAQGAASTVATQFQQLDLAATRKYDPKNRASWSVGDRFDLLPEPTNAYDANAIKVMKDGVHVGYISKEMAAELKESERRDGWSVAGPAFLHSRKGGKWGEGSLNARMVNPVLGWDGYNPSKSLGENLAAMESEVLAAIAVAPSAPRRSAHSL